MRNTLLGTIAGLLVGMIGALAYSHFLGDGSLLADLQAKLDAANAALTKAQGDTADLKKENSGLSGQVDQLQASNTQLKRPSDESAPAAAAAPQQPNDMGALASIMRNMFRGGGFQNPQQRMLLFKTRLHLTAEQQTAIQSAMDADSKARRDLMRAAFENGGRVDPTAAAKANTLDKTLADLLNPEQQRQYQQLQTDEKTARADSMANSQVNAIMPLLQLTDAQKDQVYTSLYQQQLGAPDPNNLIANPSPMAALRSQAEATQAALAKVLSPDQMTLYQQQNQAYGNGGGTRRGGGQGGNGGANGNSAATTATTSGTTYTTSTPQVYQSNGAVTSGTPVSGYVANPPAAAPTPVPATTSDTTSTNAAPATNPTTNAPASAQ